MKSPKRRAKCLLVNRLYRLRYECFAHSHLIHKNGSKRSSYVSDWSKKLTKKTKSLSTSLPNNSSKDGKQMLKLKLFFEEVIPQILEEQAKGYDCSFPLWRTNSLGSCFTVKEQYEKEHPKKMMIQNSWLWTQPFSSLASLPSSAPSQLSLRQIKLSAMVLSPSY